MFTNPLLNDSNSTPKPQETTPAIQAPSELNTDPNPSLEADTFVSMADGTDKMASAIQELFKGLLRLWKNLSHKHRLQLASETHLATIGAATTTTRHPNNPVTITTPTSIPTHMLLYHTPVTKVSVPGKLDGTQGVNNEVSNTQQRFYTISNTHLFPNNHSKLVFSLLYLTGEASSWGQPMTWQLFEGSCIRYAQFTQNFEPMFFNTEKKAKVKRTI